MDGETKATEAGELLLAAGCEKVTLRLSRDTLGRPTYMAFSGSSLWSIDGGAVGQGRTIAAALDALVRHAQAIAALRDGAAACVRCGAATSRTICSRCHDAALTRANDGAANGGAL
jgi:hypothetical protein